MEWVAVPIVLIVFVFVLLIIIAPLLVILLIVRMLARRRAELTLSREEEEQFRRMGEAMETRTVRVGLRGDVYVEILEGLDLGDEVAGE